MASWTLVICSLWLVVAMLGGVSQVRGQQDVHVKPGFKGSVPVKRASAAARSFKHKDPSTQYFLLSSPNEQTRALCYSRGRCFLKRLTCPVSCPHRKQSEAGKGGSCFINCTPSKCETSCKSRKAKCHGYGAVCYDPRFVGGDGVMFYFHGKANENFCLLSDTDLHINAHFIGTRPLGRKRDFTWVDALGIMFDNHKLSIGAKKMGAWDNKVDRFAFSYDGKDVNVVLGETSTWESSDGNVRIERTDSINSVNVIVANLMEVDVSVVPITQEDDAVHNYQLNLSQDCFAHLDVQFKFVNLSSTVDGVLGQTYRPDFKNPVKVGTPMPIMGGEHKFFATSLFKDDCKASRFKAMRGAFEEQLGEKMIQCSSSKMGGGVLCKR